MDREGVVEVLHQVLITENPVAYKLMTLIGHCYSGSCVNEKKNNKEFIKSVKITFGL